MMDSTISVRQIQELGRLRDLLRLLSELRALRDPLTSPEGLRQAIELVLRLATTFGLDQSLADSLRTIISDERIFQLVLAVIRYVAGVLQLEGEMADGRLRFNSLDSAQATEVEMRSFLEWLPIVIQLLELIRGFRGIA